MRWTSRFVFLSLTVAAAVSSEAALSRESPFAPKGGAPVAAAVTEVTPVEFRGIMSSPKGTKFGIYDPAKQQGVWVTVNEMAKLANQDAVVRSYDAAKTSVTVEYQGKTRTLSLKDPEYGPSGPIIAPPPPPMAVGGAMPRAITPGIAPAVTPNNGGEEAKRLQSVADEVRRRRMLRQSVQGGAQPATPAPPQSTR